MSQPTKLSVPFVSFRPMEKELDGDLRAAFDRVLQNSWYIEGREDEAFEAAFARYCGTAHCVGCGNGLDALVLILKAMGIGPGDEVVVPSNTFIATVLAVSYAGAAPVFVEPLLATYNIDPARVYLHGMSGGGETASLVMGMRPELYAACLLTSTQWDGDLETLAAARTPLYLAIGDRDSYYGPASLRQAYQDLHDLYAGQGLSEEEIGALLVLDVRGQNYFEAHGFSDQHAGGQAFAHDADVMGWLFSH